MKLVSSCLVIALAAGSLAQTVSTADFSCLSGVTTGGFNARQIVGRLVSSTAISLQASDEGNQVGFIGHTTGYAGGFTKGASLDLGRNGVNTYQDSGIAAGISSSGTEFLATIEQNWVQDDDGGWFITNSSPHYVLRKVAGSATYIALANEPIRMSVDGSDAYVLEQNGSSGFEVQKFTYSSGTFSLDWSTTVSDNSVGMDIMADGSQCFVISYLSPAQDNGGPGEFFVFDKSLGTQLASYKNNTNDVYRRLALGPDGIAGEYDTTSGGNKIANVAVAGDTGRVIDEVNFAFNLTTDGLSETKYTMDSHLGGPTNLSTTVRGGCMDTSDGDVFVNATLYNSAFASSVVKFPFSGSSSSYVQGAADTPGGIGISGNSNVYMMDYSTTACGIYQYSTTLSLLASSTSLGNPGTVFNDIAVVRNGSTDYVFWSEALPSGFPSYVKARAVTAAF